MPRLPDTDIGLFVLEGHQNYFSNLLRILADGDASVTIFSTVEFQSMVPEEIGSKRFSWVLQTDSESLGEYLDRVTRHCASKIDLLIIFPIYGIRDTVTIRQFDPKCKTIQMVYNVNLWTISNLALTPKLYQYLKLPLRKRFLSRRDGALVEYTTIQQYLAEKIDIDVHAFTPILRDTDEPPDITNQESELVVTIPGHIDPQRRNYDWFLDTLQDQLAGHAADLHIQLLGSPVGQGGREIVRRCDALIADGWTIDYYSEWVPVDEFERKLAQSDVLVAPLRETKKMSVVTERYGVSKASGCFGDAIKHGLPLILPETYQVPPEVEAVVTQYRTQTELCASIVQTAIKDGLSKTAHRNISERFNITSQREKLGRIFDAVLSE